MRTIRNCSCCVVGGAGFLGSHLVNHLLEDRGCKVLVIDNLCAGRREFVHPDATFIHHDITGSEEFLRRVFRENKVQFVMNYAAWPYIVDSFSRPLHVFDVNCTGAIKVINAAQEAGCEVVLQVSSAELYGSGDEGRYRESYKINEVWPVSPHSTYGAAKAAVDWYCQCAWRERKTPVIVLRQFNCVGERETHPYVIPEIISQLRPQKMWKNDVREWVSLKGEVRLGNNSFRDFLYAGGAVRLAVELLERGQFGEVYNLGSETGVKVYDLAVRIGKLMGFADVKVVEDEKRKRPWEIWALQSDNSKLCRALRITKYLPLPLDEALERTIDWYEENGCRWPWE